MKWYRFWVGAAAGCLAISGCGSDSADNGGAAGAQNSTPGGPVTVFGRVSLDKLSASAEPAAGAEVTISADLDGDGKRTDTETVKVTTDAQGRYSTTLQMKGKGEIVASFRAKDALPNHSRVVTTPPGSVRLDSAVYQGDALEVGDAEGQLRLPAGKLAIKRLAPGLTGTARIFNPARESDAFPGDFVDDKGTPIVSGVFAIVELKDEQGNPVHELGCAATLEMEVPRETWHITRDMNPGNDRIDVPRYWFDESKGQWILEGMGHLVDGTGKILAEHQLHKITHGEFPGKVIAVFEVTHFSPQNLDYPNNNGSNSVKGKAKGEKGLLDELKGKRDCFTSIGQNCGDAPPPPAAKPGKRQLGNFNYVPKKGSSSPILRPEGEGDGLDLLPLTGAYVRAEFYFQDGTPAGTATVPVEADGAFELPIGRSEPDGEDLDGNGIAGEKMFVNATVEWEGWRFHLAEGEPPTFAEREADLGDLEILQGLLRPTFCDVTGQVKYLDGTPVAGAEMAIETATWLSDGDDIAMCGESGDKCIVQAQSGADGSFHLSYAFEDTFAVSAQLWEQVGPTIASYYGDWRSMGSCPATPITLVLDWGEADTTLEVTASGSTIAWDPARPISSLWVFDAEGNLKWDVRSELAPMTSPVEFGVVPSGATEDTPASGSLEPGDTVFVEGHATLPTGYPETLSGQLELQ